MRYESDSSDSALSRREFLRSAALIGGGVVFSSLLASYPHVAESAFAASGDSGYDSEKFALGLSLSGQSSSSSKGGKGKDRIHIMWYGKQDAIILESRGRFGIVDSGEDASYPDGSDPRYPWRNGITRSSSQVHEDEFISYLKSLGAKPGNVDFYIGTHPHSDHIGTAPRVLDEFKPRYVYTPAYRDSYVTNPARLWDNLWVYDRLVAAAKRNGCKLIRDFKGKEKLTLGNMSIRLLNTDGFYKKKPVKDANYMSLGVLVEANGTRAFLAADLDSGYGFESKLAKEVGRVDLLKMGHHGVGTLSGCEESSTLAFLRALKPKVMHATNSFGDIDSEVLENVRKAGGVLCYEDRLVQLGLKAAVYTLSSSGLLMDGKKLPRFSLTRRGLVAKRNGKACAYTGFVAYKNKWYLFDGSSRSVRSYWKQVGSSWYSFNSKGAMRMGWYKQKGKRYYLHPKAGWMMTGWRKIDGTWYYFDESGALEE